MEFHNHLILFVEELRQSIRSLGVALFLLTGTMFYLFSGLLELIQEHLDEQLYFFSVAGPFLAHVKLALFASVYLLMPWIMYVLWKGLGRSFGITGRSLFWFVFSTCLLFYSGTVFCFLVTLPFGVRFLLGFQSEQLQALISIGRFVNFVTLFILAFGAIFQLPVFMIFSASVGVKRQFFERNRRYAVLIIAILAALLTPTPDVVNMALMGGPLYLLYEAGILVIQMMKIEAKSREISRS